MYARLESFGVGVQGQQCSRLLLSGRGRSVSVLKPAGEVRGGIVAVASIEVTSGNARPRGVTEQQARSAIHFTGRATQ
jgi:hypothetical protein